MLMEVKKGFLALMRLHIRLLQYCVHVIKFGEVDAQMLAFMGPAKGFSGTDPQKP